MRAFGSLHKARMTLYRRFLANELDRQAYLRQLKPLDKAVEKMEMSVFSRKALSKKRA